MSPTGPYTVGRESIVVLVKGGRLPSWYDQAPETRAAVERQHVELMLGVARDHGMLGLEGFRLITAQGDWQLSWVIEFPDLAGAEAWIEAEMAPPSGAHVWFEYELARRHAREELDTWAARPMPPLEPHADPHVIPTLQVRTDSIVILLAGRWRPEAEVTDALTRGDDEHVTLMKRVAREHGLMRIEAYRLLAPKADHHREWVIEFPTLEDAEAWLDAEVLPPHGRYALKHYLLARRWAPNYFASWVPRS